MKYTISLFFGLLPLVDLCGHRCKKTAAISFVAPPQQVSLWPTRFPSLFPMLFLGKWVVPGLLIAQLEAFHSVQSPAWGAEETRATTADPIFFFVRRRTGGQLCIDVWCTSASDPTTLPLSVPPPRPPTGAPSLQAASPPPPPSSCPLGATRSNSIASTSTTAQLNMRLIAVLVL